MTMDLEDFSNVSGQLQTTLIRASRDKACNAAAARVALERLRTLAAGNERWEQEVNQLDAELVGLPIFGPARHALHAERYERALRRLQTWVSVLHSGSSQAGSERR